MFDIFNLGARFSDFKRSVSDSFAKVRSDTDALYQWVAYLHQQNQQLQEQNQVLRRLSEEQKLTLNEFKVTLTHLPKSASEFRQILDAHYGVEPIVQRMKHIEQKLEILEFKRVDAPAQLHHPVQAQSIHSSEDKYASSVREKLLKKIARNSKEYVKNLVVSLVHKYGRIGALQLREIVVEEQGLCSRSTFYRILAEMESENLLNSVSSGKHIMYVATTQS